MSFSLQGASFFGDGDIDGATEGEDEGLSVGDKDGDRVGDTLGPVVGLWLGSGVSQTLHLIGQSPVIAALLQSDSNILPHSGSSLIFGSS